MRTILGQIAYAVLFCAGAPLLLGLWASRLEAKLSLPVIPTAPRIGLAVAFAGLVLMLRAMWDLWRHGGGLPMNAFPPGRFVSRGAYAFVRHPIYTGFGAAVFGLALATGSAAGVWIVTPVTWLALTALVVGYERIDLDRRFGRPQLAAWLARPADAPQPPTWRQRSAATVLSLGPWLLAYEACAWLGVSRHGINTALPFERDWPVWTWTAAFYLGAYGWVLLAPCAARTQASLRHFVVSGWCGTSFIIWCFLAFPFFAAPRAIDPSLPGGQWLLTDHALDTAACAFPSFHVYWAFAAAELWQARIGRAASQVVAALIAASCITTGSHSLLDVIAGWLVYLGVCRRDRIWSGLLALTERIANSWRDWRMGPIRIINHGGYVAAATTVGLWVVGIVLGPTHLPAIVTMAVCGVLGAGLWGQWLEASSQLSRPFGYFGGLFGTWIGGVVAQFAWGDAWLVGAAFALAAPIIQGVGRLRCLVQGCCHGRPTLDAAYGIRYTQPLSRVCKLARLRGVPIHPTPLYSIIGNIVIFGLLARLWVEHADAAFIIGIYYILSTCARFMEEAYRGEPQTVRWAGLAIYQWLAIGILLGGIALTTLPAPPAAPFHWSFAPLVYALPIGLVVWICMGIDFPESNRRMSRLA